jgi:hypothetical protein
MPHPAARVRLFAAFLCSAAAFLALDFRVLSAPYDWDEVDYVQASRLGLRANVWDDGSLSPREFVEFAMAKGRADAGAVPATYDEDADPLVRRHYHPPGIVALLSVVPIDRPEWALRLLQVAGGLLLIATLLWGYATLSPLPGFFGLAWIGAVAAWGAGLGFGSIQFHGWQAICSTLLAVLAVEWLRNPQTRTAIAAGIVLGAAALTLETAAILAVGLLFAFVLAGSFVDRRTRVQGFALIVVVAVAVVAISWPGALVKVSILKIAALYAYRMHLGQEYADVPNRARTLLLTLAPAVLATLVVVWGRLWSVRRVRLQADSQPDATYDATVLSVIGLSYILVLIPFALLPVYLLAGVAPLALAAACAIDTFQKQWIRWGTLGLGIGAILLSWNSSASERADRLKREDPRRLSAILNGRQAYVDGGHIYRFYLGSGVTIEPLTVAAGGQQLTVREHGAYRTLEPRDIRGSIVGLQRGRIPAAQVPDTLRGCADRGETETLRIFDCASQPSGS